MLDEKKDAQERERIEKNNRKVFMAKVEKQMKRNVEVTMAMTPQCGVDGFVCLAALDGEYNSSGKTEFVGACGGNLYVIAMMMVSALKGTHGGLEALKALIAKTEAGLVDDGVPRVFVNPGETEH